MPFIKLTRLTGRDPKNMRSQRVSIRSEIVMAVKESTDEGWTAIGCSDPTQNFVVSETFDQVVQKISNVEGSDYDDKCFYTAYVEDHN